MSPGIRTRRRTTFVLGVLASLALPAYGQGNDPDPQVPTADTSAAAASQTVTPAAEADGGVAQPVLPRSMRPFYHVFAAFGVAWLLIFAYAVSVRRRLAALEEEVDRLTR